MEDSKERIPKRNKAFVLGLDLDKTENSLKNSLKAVNYIKDVISRILPKKLKSNKKIITSQKILNSLYSINTFDNFGN